ncbi:PIG-L family deacetylase [Granulicella sibirica]|uniref:LmbE family protein n=1 Tax=Granulicella sibirica TaxID=2479048 RepID=A0A4Q0T079_9BACT|nr:PIG-L family deacetylase [Granulicella sibirica]RXH54901.1 hypothetical protein GRAN_4005 [Granulicella sibirica]
MAPSNLPATVNVLRRTVALAALLATSAFAQNPLDKADLAREHVHPSEYVREIPTNEGVAALQQSLVKLRTRASIMMIVAHPDDEDGGMLTTQSRGLGARTAMLTLTRGEGGQNVMTGDFNDALGLERTQELLAADRYEGVDQFWGTEIDFGFSKTKEEAFSQWTHERVLYDAVRAVRLYRPLVLAAVFIGGITDGHGQHQVSGEITQEVFTAAGDPKVFPEMGLAPWSPLKVYARNPTFAITPKGLFDYATGHYTPAKFYNYVTKAWSTETPATNVTIHEGDYSPLLGMTYLQFARLGLGMQKTQNGGMGIPQAGTFDVAYHRYGSRIPAADTESTFYDGIDTSIKGIATLAPGETTFLPQALTAIEAIADRAATDFRPRNPSAIAPTLREGLVATTNLIDKVESSSLPKLQKVDVTHELRVKQTQFNNALVQSLGLSLRAQLAPAVEITGPFAAFQDSADTAITAVPGDTVTVNIRLVNGSNTPLTEKEARLTTTFPAESPSESASAALPQNTPRDSHLTLKIPSDTEPTRPPFLQPNAATSHYEVADPGLRNASLAPFPLTAWVTVDYDGTPIRLGQVVQTAHRAPGQGVVYEPLTLVPALSVSVSPSAGVTPLTDKSFPLTAHLTSSTRNSINGTLALTLPKGWTSTPASVPFSLNHEGEATGITFTVTPDRVTTTPYTITAVATANGHEYREGFRSVGYPTLRPANLYHPATYATRGVDVKVPANLRVAYLAGTGDEIPDNLEDLGIHATLITTSQLNQEHLRFFDVVVLGVRAYAAHPDLATMNPQLLAYAKAGGVVIVQYNTSRYGTSEAPFAITVPGSSDRNVVVEDDPVTLLTPDAPVFNWPNKITSKDFDGWIEERGHGFAATYDPHYEALTETHDPEQEPQKGGLLYARTGKGAYVYVAYALYRQLPEGVPGAYRIFANLLSLSRNTATGIEPINPAP